MPVSAQLVFNRAKTTSYQWVVFSSQYTPGRPGSDFFMEAGRARKGRLCAQAPCVREPAGVTR